MVRFKNRYLLVELRFNSPEEGNSALKSASPRSLLRVIREAILSLHGDFGLACVQQSLNVKYMNVMTRVLILRCPRGNHRAVWSAISTISCLSGIPCAFVLLHLGGTIKSCQRALIKYNKTILKDLLVSTTDTIEKRKLEDKIKVILEKDSLEIKV